MKLLFTIITKYDEKFDFYIDGDIIKTFFHGNLIAYNGIEFLINSLKMPQHIDHENPTYFHIFDNHAWAFEAYVITNDIEKFQEDMLIRLNLLLELIEY